MLTVEERRHKTLSTRCGNQGKTVKSFHPRWWVAHRHSNQHLEVSWAHKVNPRVTSTASFLYSSFTKDIIKMVMDMLQGPDRIYFWDLSSQGAFDAFDNLRWRIYRPTRENTINLIEDLHAAYTTYPELAYVVCEEEWSLLTYCLEAVAPSPMSHEDQESHLISCGWENVLKFLVFENPYALLWNFRFDKHEYRVCKYSPLNEFIKRFGAWAIPFLVNEFPWVFARKATRDKTNILTTLMLGHAIFHDFPASVIKAFYQSYPECIPEVIDPKLGCTVIHAFVSLRNHTCCPKLFKWIVEQGPPEILTQVNSRGRTPLHEACAAMEYMRDESAPDLAEITLYLMSKCPEAIKMKCPYGRAPIREYKPLISATTPTVQVAYAKLLTVSMLKTLHSAPVFCAGNHHDQFRHSDMSWWAFEASDYSFFVEQVEWAVEEMFESYEESRLMKQIAKVFQIPNAQNELVSLKAALSSWASNRLVALGREARYYSSCSTSGLAASVDYIYYDEETDFDISPEALSAYRRHPFPEWGLPE